MLLLLDYGDGTDLRLQEGHADPGHLISTEAVHLAKAFVSLFENES